MERAPKTQEVMGWKVAASLFLIATGAGSYLIGFLFGLIDSAESMTLSKLAVILAAPFVLVGGCLLLCDMGQKSKFYHMISRPGSSWMSRGAFFVTLFLVFNLLHLFTGIWPTTTLLTYPAVYFMVGIIASILAVLTLGLHRVSTRGGQGYPLLEQFIFAGAFSPFRPINRSDGNVSIIFSIQVCGR
jgi:formate-dependent nitrite reductase membrane component NrfD